MNHHERLPTIGVVAPDIELFRMYVADHPKEVCIHIHTAQDLRGRCFDRLVAVGAHDAALFNLAHQYLCKRA